MCAPRSRRAGAVSTGARGCPRHRRAVVYKLVLSTRTTRLVSDAFPPAREGQTNQYLATLHLPVAFRCRMVFNVNVFRKSQNNDSVYLFWCRKVSKRPEAGPLASLLFVSQIYWFLFSCTGRATRPHSQEPGPGPSGSSEEGRGRIYQPPPQDLGFHLFLFPLYVQFVFSRPKQFLMYSILPA